MADTKLQIEITAENQDAIKKIEEFAKKLDGVKTSTTGAGDAQKSLSTEVFKGVASWDSLKKGIGEATDFVKDSVKSFLEAEGKMNLVRATVESSGKSYKDVGPAIEEFSKKMARLGRDDEDVALATAKLGKAVGGDFSKGMQLAKLASDLTASGIGNFDDNVDNLSHILAGKGQRALMAYNINLDENATTQEQVNAIMQKVTRTTEDYANTTEGKIAIAKNVWNDMKKEIGQGFVVAIEQAFQGQDKMNDAIEKGNTIAKAGQQLTYSLGMTLRFLGDTLGVVGSGIAGVIGAFQTLYDLIERKKSMAEMGAYMKSLTDQFNEAKKQAAESFKGIFSSADKAIAKQKEIDDAVKKNNKEQEAALIALANKNKAAAKSYDELKSKVKEFGKEADDTNHKIANTVRDYKEKQEKLLSDLLDKVKDINKSIADENSQYSTGQAQNLEELKKNIGEAIVAHEDKKASLEKDLTEEVAQGDKANQDKIKSLQGEIVQETQFITKHQETIKKYELNIATIRNNAHKDEIEKMIMAYEEKKAIDAKAHEEKLVKLQEQLAKENQAYKDSLNQQITDTNQALDEIKRTYEQKFAEISGIVGKSGALQRQVAATNQTVSIPQASALPFYKYANAPEIYKSSDNSHIPDWNAFITLGGKADFSNVLSLPARASGGPVEARKAYRVGEQGTEIFIPGQSGHINPNGGAGGISITINLNGDFYTDKEIAARWGNELAKIIKRQIRV